jgi:hypothetical protein
LTILALIAVPVGLAAPAGAATWSVSIGSATTGGGTYIRASSGSVVWSDTTTGVAFSCTSAIGAGTVPHLGVGVANPVMNQTASTFTSCTGWGGLVFTMSQSGTWSVNAASYAGGTGVTTGWIGGVALKVSTSGCSFTITGSIDYTYTNSSQVMRLVPVTGSGHVLTTSGVSGCFGIMADNHTMAQVGNFTVSAKTAAGVAGALEVTSP